MRLLPVRVGSFQRLALAGLLTLACLVSPVPAYSQDDQEWGCTLLLCFANPAGPTAAPACVPPVRRMLTEMAKFWKVFRVPSCQSANEKGSRLELQPTAYPACPEGMVALEPEAKVVITSPEQARVWQETDTRMLIGRLADDLPVQIGSQWREVEDQGIGEGDQELQSALRDGRAARDKVCVGTPLGAAQLPVSQKDERGHLSSYVDDVQTVFLFGQIQRMSPPQGHVHYQVYVDHQPFKAGSL